VFEHNPFSNKKYKRRTYNIVLCIHILLVAVVAVSHVVFSKWLPSKSVYFHLSVTVEIMISFIQQVAILAWVRFGLYTRNAAIASTAIILPAICVFIAFGITFYRRIISHKYEQSTRNIEELEAIASDLGNGTTLRGGVHIA